MRREISTDKRWHRLRRNGWQKVIAETDSRLEKIANEKRGKGTDLFPVEAVELLRQAEDADHDAHLAFELAMAADALCFALENGL